jgi:diguanylate cyclase (GGDEF)-like protein
MLRSRRTRREFALVLADIDHFKKVNDVHGHAVGDRVLRQVAALLSDRIRPRVDIVSRYGGDEFAILLPELTNGANGVRVVSERLRAEVEAFDFRQICPELVRPLTISLGAALYRGNPELGEVSRFAEKQRVLTHADDALYRAKRERNCARVWEEPPILNAPAGDLRGAERNERV